MFRFVHPRTDLRVAGGRELTLRALQVMALYPANSLFTQGYLTTTGASPAADHQMILDAGFTLELEDGREVPAGSGGGRRRAGAAQARAAPPAAGLDRRSRRAAGTS
jgi:hypothetical protein